MQKGMKYITGIAILGIVLYNSIYIRPLDEKLAEEQEVEFDAPSFVAELWSRSLLSVYDSAPFLHQLLDRLKQDPIQVFEQEAQALGIGNIGYFKVQGEGKVLSIHENNVLVDVEGQTVEMETEFIFGNAVRDASGLIKPNDYDKTADFNSISEAINDKIRAEVIPVFRTKAEVGATIRFKGALELNKAHLNLEKLEIIPVSIDVIPDL